MRSYFLKYNWAKFQQIEISPPIRDQPHKGPSLRDLQIVSMKVSKRTVFGIVYKKCNLPIFILKNRIIIFNKN